MAWLKNFIRDNPTLTSSLVAVSSVAVGYGLTKVMEGDEDAPHPLLTGSACALGSVMASSALQEWAHEGDPGELQEI